MRSYFNRIRAAGHVEPVGDEALHLTNPVFDDSGGAFEPVDAERSRRSIYLSGDVATGRARGCFRRARSLCPACSHHLVLAWFVLAVLAANVVLVVNILQERPVIQYEARLVRLDLGRFPDARCLDGSPGAYYVRKQIGGDVRSWMFVLDGGRFCDSLSSCIDLSWTDSGSSKHYPAHWHFQEPYLSRVDNPLFSGWSVAYLKSCDGALFAGSAGAVNVSGGSIYYNGESVLRSAIHDLATSNQDFKHAKEVLVVGRSRGGAAVIAQLDAINEMLKGQLHEGVRVTGFIDSGFYEHNLEAWRYIIDGHQAGSLLPKRCLSKWQGATWYCFQPSIASIHLNTPVFIWQSRYDTQMMATEVEISCRVSASCVNAYALHVLEAVIKAVEFNPHSGAFVDACPRHCWGSYVGSYWYPWEHRVEFKVDGKTPIDALASWQIGLARNSGASVLVQPGTSLCETCCDRSDSVSLPL